MAYKTCELENEFTENVFKGVDNQLVISTPINTICLAASNVFYATPLANKASLATE
jgi:hypothetical protein